MFYLKVFGLLKFDSCVWWDMDIVTFYIGISVFSASLAENRSLFSYVFLIPLWKVQGCSWMVYFWAFCSPGLHDCIWVRTTQLLLSLWLSGIISDQILWYFQHCFFSLGLFWLLGVFCASIWILRNFFPNSLKNVIRFDTLYFIIAFKSSHFLTFLK